MNNDAKWYYPIAKLKQFMQADLKLKIESYVRKGYYGKKKQGSRMHPVYRKLKESARWIHFLAEQYDYSGAFISSSNSRLRDTGDTHDEESESNMEDNDSVISESSGAFDDDASIRNEIPDEQWAILNMNATQQSANNTSSFIRRYDSTHESTENEDFGTTRRNLSTNTHCSNDNDNHVDDKDNEIEDLRTTRRNLSRSRDYSDDSNDNLQDNDNHDDDESYQDLNNTSSEE